MKIKKEFKRMPLSELHPYENNPRINDMAVEDVVQSMKQTGNIDPIEIDENGVILSGHTRLKALQAIGAKETDVLVVSGLTEAQKKKYRILANKTAEKAQWDMEKLEVELEGLEFDGFEFDFEISESVEKDIDLSLEEKELSEYQYIHYLITIKTEDESKYQEIIEHLKKMGAEVKETKNNT